MLSSRDVKFLENSFHHDASTHEKGQNSQHLVTEEPNKVDICFDDREAEIIDEDREHN